jgi:hypothetical protein
VAQNTGLVAMPAGPLSVLARPRNLVRTGVIAIVVGIWLTTFNEGDRILARDFGGLLILKVALNFLTPFVVANLGLLAGTRAGDHQEP